MAYLRSFSSPGVRHARFTAIALVVALVLSGAIPAVLAADDSNSGQLVQSGTVDPATLTSALGTLSQGVNDPQFQQQLNQFISQINSGNYAGAATTLVQLKTYANSSAGQNVPGSLKALLQSLTVGPAGVSINTDTLSSILGVNTPGQSGGPGNVRNQDPQSLSIDLKTLASLVQSIDPSLAQNLLSEASSVGQSGTGGSSSGISVTPPNLQGNPMGLPSVGPPALATAAMSTLPAIDPTMLVIPIAVGALLATLYFSRKRLGRLLGEQRIPGAAEFDEGQEGAFDPQDPRSRIIFYFKRTVRLMKARGVPKSRFETHREFSTRCSGREESEHVHRISGLYEKARFSDEGVTPLDADETARRLSLLENLHQ